MKASPLFIGIDIGTSRAKGAMYSGQGAKLAQAVISYTHVMTTDTAVEQDAGEWWLATQQIIRQLTEKVPAGSAIRALAFSTQGGSLVATDATGLPLAPAVIWQDQRGKDWRHAVLSQVDPAAVYQKTGWNLGNGLNLLQIIRMRETQPDIFHKAKLFLSVADFLSLRLTGRAAVDCSNAGINQLMDIRSQSWDDTLLALAGLRDSQLADVVPSGHVIGPLLPEVAAELNLPAETVLVSGGHDQYCAALGAGAVNDSDRLVGTGTAWVLIEICRTLEEAPATKKSLSRHVVDGLWGELMSLPTGGASLEWFLRASAVPFWPAERSKVDLAEMDAQVARRLGSANRPFFHPYLNGSSYFGSKQKNYASFSQLAFGHDWVDLAAAVMEGVAMQASWMWDAFPPQQSANPVIMTGGASHSQVWRQIFANVLQLPLAVPDEKEVGCLGAAMLAAGGAGCFPDVAEACRQMSRSRQLIEPDDQAPVIQERFRTYKEIHEGLFGQS